MASTRVPHRGTENYLFPTKTFSIIPINTAKHSQATHSVLLPCQHSLLSLSPSLGTFFATLYPSIAPSSLGILPLDTCSTPYQTAHIRLPCLVRPANNSSNPSNVATILALPRQVQEPTTSPTMSLAARADAAAGENPFKLYHYDPPIIGAVIAVLLFFGTTVLHFWQLIRARCWFVLPLAIGGICT